MSTLQGVYHIQSIEIVLLGGPRCKDSLQRTRELKNKKYTRHKTTSASANEEESETRYKLQIQILLNMWGKISTV